MLPFLALALALALALQLSLRTVHARSISILDRSQSISRFFHRDYFLYDIVAAERDEAVSCTRAKFCIFDKIR